jgi:hypothetical protein
MRTIDQVSYQPEFLDSASKLRAVPCIRTLNSLSGRSAA